MLAGILTSTVESIIIALVAAIAGGIVTVTGYWSARKLGLTESQRALVQTLKDTTEALEKRVDQLEAENTTLLGRIQHLEDDNVTLRNINDRLRKRLEAAE